MALPKPKSIFDEEHPVASTGMTYAYPSTGYSVIGIALKNLDPKGKDMVIMRGAVLCPDPDATRRYPNPMDAENESLINHVVTIYNGCMKWLRQNKQELDLVEAGGMLYAQENAKPWDTFDPPTYAKELTMGDSGHEFTVTGIIEKKKIRDTRNFKQGDAREYYNILIIVNGQECVPVIVGRNWH